MLWIFPLVSSLIELGMQGIVSEIDVITFFPHFPHLNNVARELKCPRLLSGTGSARDIISLQNRRLWTLSFLSFSSSISMLLNSVASLENDFIIQIRQLEAKILVQIVNFRCKTCFIGTLWLYEAGYEFSTSCNVNWDAKIRVQNLREKFIVKIRIYRHVTIIFKMRHAFEDLTFYTVELDSLYKNWLFDKVFFFKLLRMRRTWWEGCRLSKLR